MNTNSPTHQRTSDPMRIFIYKDQQQQGPLTVEEALTKERDGTFLGSDNAWIEGEPNWVPLNTILRRFSPPPPPKQSLTPPPPPAPVIPQLSEQSTLLIRRGEQQFGPYPVSVTRLYLQAGNIRSTDEAQPDGSNGWWPVTNLLDAANLPSLHRRSEFSHAWLWFMITSILATILTLASTAVLTPEEGRRSVSYSNEKMGVALLVFSWLAMIASLVLSSILQYRGWTRAQRPDSPTTPGQAVGLMFVPLFNFYWQFVAVRGLAVELNRRPGFQDSVSVGLGTTVCVFFCILTIPPLAPIGFLGYTVCGIIFWKSVAKAVHQKDAPR